MKRKTFWAHVALWLTALLLAWCAFNSMQRIDPSQTPPKPVDTVNHDDYQLPTL